jgi:putative ABC transport system permease protein
MFKFSKIALRNLFRNKRRSLITLSILIFGSSALIITRGFMGTMFEGARESAILQGIGHIQISHPDFLNKEENKPLEFGLEDYQALQQLLEAEPHIGAVEARVEFMGLVSNGDKSVAFMGNAGQPDRQQRMKMLTKVEMGSDLLAATQPNPAILGTGLAKSLNARMGDTLTLLSTTTSGAINGIDITVAGIFTTGFKEADARLLNVRLDTAQRLMDTGRVTKLVIGLDKTENTGLVEARLAQLFREKQWQLATRNWTELSLVYKQVTTTFNVIFVFLGLVIFILVVLSSSNTMMMTVFERFQEIGTLMALGTKRRWILRLFLLEGLFMGTLGGALGALFSFGFGSFLNSAKIMVPPAPGTTLGFPITVQHLPGAYGGVFLLAIFMMVAASLLPALRGARMKIVDALGHI